MFFLENNKFGKILNRNIKNYISKSVKMRILVSKYIEKQIISRITLSNTNKVKEQSVEILFKKLNNND